MSTNALLSIKDNLSHAYLLWGYGPQEGKIAIIKEFLLTLEPAPFVDSLIIFPVKKSCDFGMCPGPDSNRQELLRPEGF